jgi:hypothetical protein
MYCNSVSQTAGASVLMTGANASLAVAAATVVFGFETAFDGFQLSINNQQIMLKNKRVATSCQPSSSLSSMCFGAFLAGLFKEEIFLRLDFMITFFPETSLADSSAYQAHVSIINALHAHLNTIFSVQRHKVRQYDAHRPPIVQDQLRMSPNQSSSALEANAKAQDSVLSLSHHVLASVSRPMSNKNVFIIKFAM